MRITDGIATRVIHKDEYEEERARCLRPDQLTLGENYVARFIMKPFRPKVYAADFIVAVDELKKARELPIVSHFVAPYFRLSMLEVFPAGHCNDKADIRSIDEAGILYGNRVILSFPINNEIGYLPRFVDGHDMTMDGLHDAARARVPAGTLG